MIQNLPELLKTLSTEVGVSGYEHAIRALLRENFAPYVDEFTEDRVGSLRMLKRGTPVEDDSSRRTIMLSAHTDEIGAMVTHIDRGFIRIAAVGGLDIRVLMAQEVTVFGTKPFDGVIASRPPHFSGEDRSKFPPLGEFHVDVGLSPAEIEKHIHVGDIVAVKKSAVDLLDGKITGKAMDNRASVAALYVCLQELSQLKHTWDVVAVASCQEEFGLRGAFTSAYHLNPDAAIAVDVTFANAPGVDDGNPAELNGGPAIGVGANIHPVMAQRLKDTAADLEMSVQIEPLPGSSGTDAWAIQTSRAGIPTALLSIPQRYMHTPVEIVALKDITRTGRLMAHFIAGLTEDFIDELIPKDGLED